jgi:hypothetical protein
MLSLQRGTSINLYTNFLTLENKEAVTIVDPKVTVRHINSLGVTIVDVNEQPLTLAIETLYYFKWTIPAFQDVGFYTVEYEATVDGEYAEGNESFRVVDFDGDTSCESPLTTAVKVAEYLGVDSSKIKEDWITWATAYIEKLTCQKFCPIIVTEKIDIESKQDVVLLENFPVLELTAVIDSGEYLNLNTVLLYDEEGTLKLDLDSEEGLTYFTKGRQKLHVTYKYGYPTVPSEIEWAATVLVASIGLTSLKESGSVSVGDVVEEEIGNYRRKRSTSSSGGTDFSSSVEGSKEIEGRLEEDVFSAKNILRLYKCRGMRAV